MIKWQHCYLPTLSWQLRCSAHQPMQSRCGARTESHPRETLASLWLTSAVNPLCATTTALRSYYSGTPYQVPDAIASLYVPCIYTEEWL
jgi:hypothetical protein